MSDWSDEETDEPLLADHRNFYKVEKWNHLLERGVEVGEIWHKVPIDAWNGGFASGLDSARRDYANTGPLVSFARSGIAAHWKASAYQSILELAEKCDVPVRWSCRTGVCHNCESGLVSGAVAYGPQPLEEPADGNLLVCCSQPIGDVVIDL